MDDIVVNTATKEGRILRARRNHAQRIERGFVNRHEERAHPKESKKVKVRS